jgi:3-oxoacyl-[acyl-carrier protein] reductase
MDLNLKNKNYIVTGSSRGIGLEVSKILLNEGAKVMIIGRNSEALNDIREQLDSEFPKKVLIYEGDLIKDGVSARVVKKIISEWGSIDGIIANAGGVKPVPEWDILNTDWNWYFSSNFDISVKIVTQAVPYLKKTAGNIIFISSIAGIEEIGAPLPYSASKAALTMYSKGLSRKLAPFNIRVNTIAPGNILFKDGNWDKKLKADAETVIKMLEAKVPLKRFGTPEDIGNMVAFLLSEKATFITGSCIVIDGGQTSMIS